MTAAADADPTQARWRAWLEGIGADLQPERPVVSSDRVEAGGGQAPTELFVRQIFVRADLEERRSVDLLLVALLERGPRADTGHGAVELVVVGPDALRAQIVAGPSGFTITELRLAPAAPRLLTVSVALIRVARAGRSRDVLESIEALGRLLDYAGDADGSAAVAHALVRRLEVLTSGPGVQLSLAGLLRRPADPNALESLYLLADAALGLDDDVELRDGRLTVITAAPTGGIPIAVPQAVSGAAVPRRPSSRDPVARDRKSWTGGDYVLLRVGPPAQRQAAEARPLWQRRQEHALTEDGLGAETTQQADSYSSRAAAVRQARRAQQIVEQALAGDQASAAAVLSSALTQPGAEGPLVENLAVGMTAEADFWALAPVLRQVREGTDGDHDRDRIVALLEERLGLRLDHLLGLGLPESLESTIPVTTPIVLEVSDALVPIVDSRQDGGHFLYELIPEMRDRVRDAIGVVVPGVRLRGNPDLAPGGFVIQIDEVPVVEAVMRVDGRYTVRSVAAEAVPADADVAEVHPVSGEPGRWRIEPVDEAADTANSAGTGVTFSCPQYLVHRLERVIRASLGMMLGIQEVDTLLGQWRTEDEEAVRRTLVGPNAAQRLTVLLQDLVAERVPVADWRAVLDAIAAAGGIDTDLRALHGAARLRLRHALPGPRTGPAALRVPADLQAALSGRRPAQFAVEAPEPAHAQIEFLTWLRRSVETLGPVLSVITDDATRPTVAALARMESMAVVTFSEEEVTVG
jgi:FHIPEP family